MDYILLLCCVMYFVELVFLWVFLRGFLPLGFFLCFFPWRVLGSTFLNLVVVYVPPALKCGLCIVCSVCVGAPIVRNYDVLVWRALFV